MITRAPSALAICTTIEPTPPVPPLTNSVSPDCSLASRTRPMCGGDADEGAGGRRFVGHAGGSRIEPALVDGGIFGERALPAHESLVGSPDSVADFEFLGVWAQLFDDARQIGADDVRQRDVHLDRAAANIRIDRIDGRGFHADEHLVAGWFGRGQVADDDGFGGAGLGDVGGFHGGLLLDRVAKTASDGRGFMQW